MTNVRESRYEPSPCLNCGAELDTAANRNGATVQEVIASGQIPISICLECGHVMALTPELKHRPLDDKEIIELAGNKELIMMLNVAAKVRAARAKR